MKKIGLFTIFFCVFVIITSVIFSAEAIDIQENAEEIVGYASFLEAIPDEVKEFAREYGFDLENETAVPPFSVFFKIVISLFLDGLMTNLPLVSFGFALILIFKLLSALTPDQKGGVEGLGFLTVVSSGIYSFSVIETLLRSLTSVSSRVSSFFTAALPVITYSQVLAGEPERSLMISATLPFVLLVISTFITSVFYPLCWFCYAASLLGFSRSGVSLRPFVCSVKKYCTKGVEIVSGLAVGVFCIQRASAGVIDSMTRKGAKFAFARLIPVAGSTLSDGLETIYACGQSIRGRVGVVSVLVLLGMFVAPCISGLIFTFLYSFLSSVSQSFGVPVLSDFFADVKDTFSMMTCFSLCSMIVLSSGLLILLGG